MNLILISFSKFRIASSACDLPPVEVEANDASRDLIGLVQGRHGVGSDVGDLVVVSHKGHHEGENLS